MKNLNIMEVHWKFQFLGMGGQFADLKRSLAKKMGGGGVFEGAGDTTMHTMVYKGPQKTTTKTENFSVIHDIFTRNCVIYFMWKTHYFWDMLKQAMKQNAAMNVPHYLSCGVIHLVHTKFSKNLTFLPVFWKTLHRS